METQNGYTFLTQGQICLGVFFVSGPGKGINFKTFHVQIKELNDIVLATPNQTMRGRKKDDCKWISLFVLKRELSASDLR